MIRVLLVAAGAALISSQLLAAPYTNDKIIITAKGKRLECRTRVKTYSRFLERECVEPADWAKIEENAKREWKELQDKAGTCGGGGGVPGC